MSQLTRPSIHTMDVYQILDFYDEAHFPKLKTLSFHHKYWWRTSLLSHLNLWRRHIGVQSLSLNGDSIRWVGEFGGKIVTLFPAVKQFDFIVNGWYLTSK